MVCSCCGKQHDNLRMIEAKKLLPGNKFLVCPTCKAGGMVPRYLIILVGRSSGWESVKEYIRNEKYCGEEILARELI